MLKDSYQLIPYFTYLFLASKLLHLKLNLFWHFEGSPNLAVSSAIWFVIMLLISLQPSYSRHHKWGWNIWQKERGTSECAWYAQRFLSAHPLLHLSFDIKITTLEASLSWTLVRITKSCTGCYNLIRYSVVDLTTATFFHSHLCSRHHKWGWDIWQKERGTFECAWYAHRFLFVPLYFNYLLASKLLHLKLHLFRHF